jgi:hypothetical protein
VSLFNDTFNVGSGRTRYFCLSSFNTTNCRCRQLRCVVLLKEVLTSLVQDITSNNCNRRCNNGHCDFSGYIVVI